MELTERRWSGHGEEKECESADGYREDTIAYVWDCQRLPLNQFGKALCGKHRIKVLVQVCMEQGNKILCNRTQLRIIQVAKNGRYQDQ